MTGMCEECDAASTLLPSIESFLQQWRLPKVHYLFYEYFYKAVIKDSVWNDRIDVPRPGPDDRLGTRIAKVYAYSLIANHYHAWVYHFKIEYPSNTLLTEYEKIEHHEDQRDDNDQQEIEIKLFCGDLDLAECKISVPNERNDDFKLLLSSGPNANPAACKAARVHDQEILKGIKAKIDYDRQGNGNTGSTGYCGSYDKMNSKLEEDLVLVSTDSNTRARKQKQRSKSSMMENFTSSTCKSKKGSEKIMRWSAEGKRFVSRMLGEIRKDEKDGIRKKWEDMYKKISKATKQGKAQRVDEDDESKEQFDVDENVLYAEV
jgi:hypothetical protein